jgi:hypothetical protein
MACAATLSMALKHLGHVVEYEQWAETLATNLKNTGWQRKEVSDGLQVGDVFVCEDLNSVQGTDHIGIVAGLHRNPNLFYCFDNNLKSPEFNPYIRNIKYDHDPEMPKRTPIDYLLRKPKLPEIA